LDVSCVVLAGGKSTRLGRNKVAETIGNRSLLERVVSRLNHFHTRIFIVTAEDSSLPRLGANAGITIVHDIYPEKGSIGGIYSGLMASRSEYNLVVACDMPFLNLDLLRYMLEISPGNDIVVPQTEQDVFEPLHAVYSCNCIVPLDVLIKKNVFKILELFPLVRVRYVKADEINRFDPSHLSFFNVNTEADLLIGKKLAGKEDV
jgi:molybdopterin-guanine dinucleotide biosynthesis protein A